MARPLGEPHHYTGMRAMTLEVRSVKSTLVAPISPITITGTITSVQGSNLVAKLPKASVGDMCWIETRDKRVIGGQVVSFSGNSFSLALFEQPEGIFPGSLVRTRGTSVTIPIGHSLLGRTISALGKPIDGLSRSISNAEMRSIYASPPAATTRPLIDTKITTGIRAIDGFCTLGKGQRIAISAPAGVGKSSLLGAIGRNAQVDVIVVALVGERGREVREFIEETLGREGMSRSVVIAATSDEPSLTRQIAPLTATTVAEYFRDRGLNVLLIVDSLTRMARAIRETSLAAGDLPVRHGYTNSVYTLLPRLIERAGTNSKGSITALFTVLTNAENDIDPLAEEIKSLLDGHIALSQELATIGVQPAIDVTRSISRLFTRLNSSPHRETARHLTHAISRYMKEREIALLGGTPDQELASILANRDQLLGLITQDINKSVSLEESHNQMRAILELLQLTSSLTN